MPAYVFGVLVIVITLGIAGLIGCYIYYVLGSE